MNVSGSLETPDRLRSTPSQRTRVRPEDAEVSVRPNFTLLLGLALLAIIAQSTILRSLAFHGAHVSLVTVLVVWAGLRGGATSGGWLGLLSGLVEDALGGGGANVVGTTLVGYIAGLLSVRFFADSLPVFLSAVAAATWLRGAVAYLIMEVGLGERGMFHRLSHELVWQTLLNCVVAVLALLVLRVASHMPAKR